MKNLHRAIAAWAAITFLFLLSACAVSAREASHSGQTKTIRVGVYDSRAIAIAYVGSDIFKKYLENLKTQRDAAKATGDTKKVAEIEAKGKARQNLLHKQGFGTYPVDDYLAQIKDKLPEIMKKANVSRIISKWDKKALAQDKSAEIVDITPLLLDAFKPNERTRRNAEMIQKHPPISAAQLLFLRD